MATINVNISADGQMGDTQPTDQPWGAWTAWSVRGYSSENDRAIMRLQLPDIAGVITNIEIFIYRQGGNTASMTINIHELTRSDWVESQFTWWRYKTGSNWTNNGGDYNATIIDSFSPSTGLGWDSFVIVGAGATNPLTVNFNDQIDLLLKANTEGSTDRSREYRAKEYVDSIYRPYAVITYLPAVDINNSETQTINENINVNPLEFPDGGISDPNPNLQTIKIL
jgi:hypothetical protein